MKFETLAIHAGEIAISILAEIIKVKSSWGNSAKRREHEI